MKSFSTTLKFSTILALATLCFTLSNSSCNNTEDDSLGYADGYSSYQNPEGSYLDYHGNGNGYSDYQNPQGGYNNDNNSQGYSDYQNPEGEYENTFSSNPCDDNYAYMYNDNTWVHSKILNNNQVPSSYGLDKVDKIVANQGVYYDFFYSNSSTNNELKKRYTCSGSITNSYNTLSGDVTNIY